MWLKGVHSLNVDKLNKNIVIATWVLTIGSMLWLLGKIEPDTLFEDWLTHMVILYTGIFGGNALVKMMSKEETSEYWSALRRMIVPFYVGIAAVITGIIFAAFNALGSQWIGIALSGSGILFYNYVLARVDFYYRELTT